jgi:hypothetical protein
LELAVFIQGGSERSNGYQVGGVIQGNDALDFMLDSASKFGVGLQRFSILCSYSLAFEHYARARNSLGRRTPRLATYFSLIWSELFCPDNVHHSQKRSLVVARRFFKPLHTFLFRVMRKFWMFENFNWHTPVKNQKFNLSNDMDVSTIARYIFEST